MDSEQEELEALKKWWSDNGRAVIVGLVLGLAGVFGWTTWKARTEATAEQLSVLYEGMVDAAASNDNAKVVAQADGIIAEHPDSEYAALAGLVGAKSALVTGQANEAQRLLTWVADNAKRDELRDVARIRSARLMLDAGRDDAALGTLDKVDTPAFAASVDELRGDIFASKGATQDAAKAYRAALTAGSFTTSARNRLQIKLDSLGLGDASQSQASQ